MKSSGDFLTGHIFWWNPAKKSNGDGVGKGIEMGALYCDESIPIRYFG
jgi:hypothetical protein